MTGTENGIKWEVKEHISPTHITIYDLDGNVLHDEEYKWLHEPIFGPDISDVISINEILDKLIDKYGGENSEQTAQ